MAACGAFKHIFDHPIQENPSFLESWKQTQSPDPIDDSPIAPFFGELRFEESLAMDASSISSSSLDDDHREKSSSLLAGRFRHRDSFSSASSESLSHCTEGLGVESSDMDVEDLSRNGSSGIESPRQENHYKRSRIDSRREFPPPISCIGWNGRPWVSFKSFREGGRFILKEIRIPTEESLHACRENGRLKLRFVHSDDEILEEDDEESNRSAQKNA